MDELDTALLIRSMAPSTLALVVFGVAAITTPLGPGAAPAVLCVLVVLVVAGAVVGGRATALLAAVMAALAFDFFHVAPLRVLHARTLAELTAGLLTVGWSVSRSR